MQATKELIRDQFAIKSDIKWQIDESENTRVDGKYILARVVGPGFLNDGVSRNNRRYTPECWENALAGCKDRLADGGLLGTAGHDQDLNEGALLEGKITHFVSKLWVEKGVGMIEMFILNTPGGQILNNVLRAGFKIPVSSRAYGSYSGKGEMGEDIIDPETFHLETFDFVLIPGVDIAYPKVVESAKGKEMDNEKLNLTESLQLIERLSREKTQISTQLDEALEENRKLRTEKQSFESDITKYQKALKLYTEKVGSSTEIREGLRKWMEIEPFKKIAQEVGLAQKVTGVMELAEKYAQFGAPDKIKTELAELAEYRKLGARKHIQLMARMVDSYLKLGKPKELIERLKKMVTIEKKVLEKTRKDDATKIAKKFNESTKFIEGLLTKMSAKDVIQMLKNKNEGTKNLNLREGGQRRFNANTGPDGFIKTAFKSMQ